MSISIVLADDHPVVLRGVAAVLGEVADFSISGMAKDGAEAVRLVEGLKPDILVLDLMMPRLSGLEVLRIVQESAPKTRVVVLSLYSNTAFVASALQNGATGYVLKGCTEESLIRAIREAAAGRRFLSPPVAEIAINSYIEQVKSAGTFDPHETLSARQREVLQSLAEGKTTSAIAERLGISPRTVENHRSTLMKRLGLQTQTDLIRHAMRHGLIPPEPGNGGAFQPELPART